MGRFDYGDHGGAAGEGGRKGGAFSQAHRRVVGALGDLLGPICEEDVAVAVRARLERRPGHAMNCWRLSIPPAAFDRACPADRDQYAEMVLDELRAGYDGMPPECFALAAPARAPRLSGCSVSCQRLSGVDVGLALAEAEVAGWGVARDFAPMLRCAWDDELVPMANGLLVTRDAAYAARALACPSDFVSRTHGSFGYDADLGEWYFTDTSSNGTELNGRRLRAYERAAVAAGDVLRFAGEARMEVEVVGLR